MGHDGTGSLGPSHQTVPLLILRLPALGRALLSDYGDVETLMRLNIFHTPSAGWTYPGPFATPIDLGLPPAGDYVGPLVTRELLAACEPVR